MQRQDLPVTRRGDLTDEQWNRIYPYLPVGRKGRPFDKVRDTVKWYPLDPADGFSVERSAACLWKLEYHIQMFCQMGTDRCI